MSEKTLKEKLEQTEQQLERALALFTISSEMHKTLNIDEVYKIIFDTLKQIIGVRSASILLKGEKTGKLEKAASMGANPRTIEKYSLKLENRTIGEIRIQELLSQKKKLTKEDTELLTILADQAAVAITGAKLYTASSESINTLDKSLKDTESVPEKRLTKSIAEDLSLKYIYLLRTYINTKSLEKEESLVEELCQKLIEYDITPKGVIGIHLKTVPQVGTIGGLETRRITFESRMVLLKVITTYADLLRKKVKGE